MPIGRLIDWSLRPIHIYFQFKFDTLQDIWSGCVLSLKHSNRDPKILLVVQTLKFTFTWTGFFQVSCRMDGQDFIDQIFNPNSIEDICHGLPSQISPPQLISPFQDCLSKIDPMLSVLQRETLSDPLPQGDRVPCSSAALSRDGYRDSTHNHARYVKNHLRPDIGLKIWKNMADLWNSIRL